MRIEIIGAGYVGVVTAATLSSWGHRVTLLDINSERIEQLSRGSVHFYEPDLEPILQQQLAEGALDCRLFPHGLIDQAQIAMICVGTPGNMKGHTDLSQLEAALQGIATRSAPEVIAIKSTVPVGTGRKIMGDLARRNCDSMVVANPEFLREGSALYDSFHPDRVVIGVDQPKAAAMMQELYNRLQAPLVITCPEEAELIKYASNAFLATKISFINELSRFCSNWDIDINVIARGIGLDHRVGTHFLQAGSGFGGSCLPKDLKSLIGQAATLGEGAVLLRAVQQVNESQRGWIVQQVEQILGNLAGKTLAAWGLSFKAGTDDLRDSPAIDLISLLIDKGAQVTAYDPKVAGSSGLPAGLVMADNPETAVVSADLLVLLTEWPELINMDWQQVGKLMSGSVVLDTRNCLDPEIIIKAGLIYRGIGRAMQQGIPITYQQVKKGLG